MFSLSRDEFVVVNAIAGLAAFGMALVFGLCIPRMHTRPLLITIAWLFGLASCLSVAWLFYSMHMGGSDNPPNRGYRGRAMAAVAPSIVILSTFAFICLSSYERLLDIEDMADDRRLKALRRKKYPDGGW